MARDLAMIFSVLISVVSIGFGVYKNIEANNARGFAYEQAYRMLNAVQQANIGSALKASITSHALDALQPPPGPLDLSRSSADEPKLSACPQERQIACRLLASDLADANAQCSQKVVAACNEATTLKNRILSESCIPCYAP